MFEADTDRLTALTRLPLPSRLPVTGRYHTADAWWREPCCTVVDNSEFGGRNGWMERLVVTGMRGSARPRWATLDVGAAGAVVTIDLKAT